VKSAHGCVAGRRRDWWWIEAKKPKRKVDWHVSKVKLPEVDRSMFEKPKSINFKKGVIRG
jgi:hypothetical protein